MRHRQSLALFAALSLVLGLPAPAMAAAFSNGNFESPSVVNPPYDYVPITNPGGVIAPGWTVTGHSVDHGRKPAGTDCLTINKQCVDLNGHGPGGIEQTFDTQRGDPCLVELYMSRHRDLASSSATMYASVDGNPTYPASFTHSAAAMESPGDWVKHSFIFTPSSSSTTLAFTSGVTTGAAGPQIDDVTVTCGPPGQLKVCKVAGPGLAAGTSFTFTAGPAQPFQVPAGTGPGGTCTVGPVFPQGSTVTVTEAAQGGIQVTDITVAPPGRLVGTPNLAGRSVDVTIGSGVTEVTFENRKGDTKSGYLQICKEMKGPLPVTPGPAASFTFYVNPGNLGPFVVPMGSCSPAIKVAAGTAIIKEVPSPGFHLAGCSTIPAGQQGPCDSPAGTSTVTVDGGDVSTQTIAFLTNRRQQHKDE